MEAADIVRSDARYGLHLVDTLTGRPLISTSAVAVRDQPLARAYVTTASTWAIESVAPGDATFDITAEHYVPRAFLAGGGDGPPVPALIPNLRPGRLEPAPMNPRTGYPFPATLTRVVGLVLFQPDPSIPGVPATGAAVRVFGIHDPITPGPLPAESSFDTLVTDDGQYTAWFLPLGPPAPPGVPAGYKSMPHSCRVRIKFTPPGGVEITKNIPALMLTRNRTITLPTRTFP